MTKGRTSEVCSNAALDARELPKAWICPRTREMSLTIELKDSAEQTAFNLKRWAEVLAVPSWLVCLTGSRPTAMAIFS